VGARQQVRAHQTFVQAWKPGPSFDPSHGLEPWLVTIASWVRRRADLEDIAGVDHVLAEIDASAKELERRMAAVPAAQNTYEPDQRNP